MWAGRGRGGHLFVGRECEVGAHHTVAIVSEQYDLRLFGVNVERLEMWGVPTRVDGDWHLDVAQDTVVSVRQSLSNTSNTITQTPVT